MPRGATRCLTESFTIGQTRLLLLMLVLVLPLLILLLLLMPLPLLLLTMLLLLLRMPPVLLLLLLLPPRLQLKQRPTDFLCVAIVHRLSHRQTQSSATLGERAGYNSGREVEAAINFNRKQCASR